MSNFPSIPPNCYLFRSGKNAKLNDETWFIPPCKPFDTPTSGGSSFQYISIDDFQWRPIIAAVARCAWFDFAVENRVPQVSEEMDNEFQIALMNAEAWRVWGLKK